MRSRRTGLKVISVLAVFAAMFIALRSLAIIGLHDEAAFTQGDVVVLGVGAGLRSTISGFGFGCVSGSSETEACAFSGLYRLAGCASGSRRGFFCAV